MKISVALLCAVVALSTALADDGKPILDMNAEEVAELLARNGIVKTSAHIDDSNDGDGAALVDFVRWYESMPPFAKFIEANNPRACNAWADVAKWMEKQQQIAAAVPSAFLEWCEKLIIHTG